MCFVFYIIINLMTLGVGCPFFVVLPGRGRPFLTKLPGPWMRLFCCLAGAVGLYHFYTHFSSCFPLPQQAFLPEMGLKCRLLAASSPVFKKAGTFVSKLGAEPHAPAAGRKTKAPCLGRGQKNMPSNLS